MGSWVDFQLVVVCSLKTERALLAGPEPPGAGDLGRRDAQERLMVPLAGKELSLVSGIDIH